MIKPKIVLYGSDAQSEYHPLNAVQETLVDLFSPLAQVDVRTETQGIQDADLSGCRVFVCYRDQWKEPLEAAQSARLVRYVAGGGAMLVIHNGISLQTNAEWARLIGARFVDHPPYQRLSFRFDASDHSIFEGLEEFRLDEEPYRFEFDPTTNRIPLLSYSMEGRSYPAGWIVEYGVGTVVYVMPGHHAPTFRDTNYRTVLKNAVRWLLDVPRRP